MKFRRVKKDSVFFGVCTGIQDLFKQKGHNVDLFLIRFLILLLAVILPEFLGSVVIAAYFVAALIFPTKEEDEEKLNLNKKDEE